ncbi:hypothetical protein CO731_01242 [Aminobacter sp. MSH1]|uniref:hypothetical protein n=1 Tax=Aminobacter sp. MSH1 TaxID=374606 RepID=UPI000D348F74|nr:hypothetical protein [Aminobacter sp. MSH1]AWC21789.1 hypothetical protein CO731_01242 [Aminobacter sp. MSH1]
MISFVKKGELQPPKVERKPSPAIDEDNRFEQIRNAAAERRRKSDAEDTRRRAREAAEDNRLL